MELTTEQRQQLRRLAPDHLKAIEKINRQARSARNVAKPEAATDELVIDFRNFAERLTVGDIEDMERASGVPTFEMAAFGGNNRSLSGVAALIWVLKRQDDPKFTYKQAREIPVPVLFDVLKQMRQASAEEDEGDDPLDQSASPSA